MERYKLNELYTLQQFSTQVESSLSAISGLAMGITTQQRSEVVGFVASAIYGYFYDDLVAYEGEDEDDVKSYFTTRLGYDIAVKMPYWYRKYNYIKKLLTDSDLSLFQTSKVSSSSSDLSKSASGTLQKTATTPTGVSTGTDSDAIEITIDDASETETDAGILTEGFADKYTNAQQKFANAGRVEGERSGLITREGSIDELIKVLEKLPSSFADEVTREVGKHFIFDYEGEERGYYNETL